MGSSNKLNLKVVLVGRYCTGKTCLVHRYIHGTFKGEIPKSQVTLGAAFVAKRLAVDNTNVVMGIWDTAGSERFDSMTRIYYRGAGAAIVCYDLSDESSFDKAEFWVNEIKRNEEYCKIYLCGTKYDLVDEQNMENVKRLNKFAERMNADVFVTSSVTGYNINEMFLAVASDYAHDPANQEIDGSTILINGTTDLHGKSLCCARGKNSPLQTDYTT